MSTEFGKRLKAARKHAKLTQKELAPLTGMSQSNLSDLENTAHGSSFTSQIATACGVNPQWLATGAGPMASSGSLTLTPGTAEVRVTGYAPTVAQALPVVLGAITDLPPARWASVRAQLDQMAAHPEMRDDVLSELQALLQPAPAKRQGNA